MNFTRLLRLPATTSCLLFGPRQTGKSTLVREQVDDTTTWTLDLLRQDVFLHYARAPGQFRADALGQMKQGCTTIVIDEVQKLPPLLDEVHSLIEQTGARCVLTGSSARKLRRGGANLLAGRAVVRRLHPLTRAELGPSFDLERVLRLGSLPPVVTRNEADAGDLLRAYGDTYLREEIQAESVVRNLGGFARFLDLAAATSGRVVNVSAVARDAALPIRAVQSYFEILDDTLLCLRLPSWRQSERTRLLARGRNQVADAGGQHGLARAALVRRGPSGRATPGGRACAASPPPRRRRCAAVRGVPGRLGAVAGMRVRSSARVRTQTRRPAMPRHGRATSTTSTGLPSLRKRRTVSCVPLDSASGLSTNASTASASLAIFAFRSGPAARP